MKKKAFTLLQKLTEAHGASGSEDAVRQIVRDELTGDFETDRVGSLICKRTGKTKTPKVMLSAHMDEIGFAVQSITPEGFLRFTNLGGWWEHTLLSQRVRILTSSGKEVLGVIISTPVHFLKSDQRKRVLPLKEMYIDVGAADAAEVQEGFGIQLGDPIVPQTTFERLANPDLMLGKAFDNRIGVATMILGMQALKGKSHPNTIYAAGTVQEEVGCRGAGPAARLIAPDVAIVLEGPPADDTPGNNPAEAQGALGQGVQMRLLDPTALMNRQLTQFVKDTAAAEKIPLQIAVRRSGGTDAKSIHLSGIGVPSVVLGVPARYIHSHNSMVDVNDLLAAAKLLTALLRRLDRKTVASFTDFAS